MVPYNLASVFLVCGSWRRCSSLDQQLKRGGSRSAPQLLSLLSLLCSQWAEAASLEAESCGFEVSYQGGGGDLGQGGSF